MRLFNDLESAPGYPSAEPPHDRLDKLSVTKVFQTPIITQRQAPTATLETCGYQDGNPSIPRSAEQGYDCRTDTKLGL
jgi:hypothetical protein